MALFFFIFYLDFLHFNCNFVTPKHKTMIHDELFNRFVDDEYQADQFKLQIKTPYRERNPKKENIIDMVSLANKIFLK